MTKQVVIKRKLQSMNDSEVRKSWKELKQRWAGDFCRANGITVKDWADAVCTERIKRHL